MKVVCPYCDKPIIVNTQNKDAYNDGEGLPCFCKRCKKDFVIFLSIVVKPEEIVEPRKGK